MREKYILLIWILVWANIVLFQSCDKNNGNWHEGIATKYGGVVVKNPGVAIYDRNIFQLIKVATIGEKEGKPLFQSTRNIQVDDDGNIYVLDSKALANGESIKLPEEVHHIIMLPIPSPAGYSTLSGDVHFPGHQRPGPPVILVFMLILINNKKLMGGYTNRAFYNILSWVTVAVPGALSLAYLYFIIRWSACDCERRSNSFDNQGIRFVIKLKYELSDQFILQFEAWNYEKDCPLACNPVYGRGIGRQIFFEVRIPQDFQGNI